MTKDKREPVFSTQIGKPVPGKHTCGCEDDLLAVGRNSLEQCLGGRWHIAVQEYFPGLVEDTDVHSTGVEIDTTVKGMLFGVESH